MITITVDSDSDEAAVRAALMSGALSDALGRRFVIRRDGTAIGGGGITTAIHYTGTGPPPPAGGGGGGSD